jgi:regulator of sigma D
MLVDYVSAGHFEIYEELLEKAEHCGSEAVALAKGLFPQFSASTDLVLAFTDRYTEAGDEEMVTHFDHDLARLGADLASRFELEDRLIGALCETRGAAA